jgi:hypothetical protein
MYEFCFMTVQLYGRKIVFCLNYTFIKKKLPIIRQLEAKLFFEFYIARFVVGVQAVLQPD